MKPNFKFDGTDKYYFSNNKFITHFFNALSATFPGGEQFFVRAVRRYRNYDKGEFDLRIAKFMQEEAFHTIAHDSFNRYAETYNIPIYQIQKNVDEALKFIEKHISPIQCLAITSALEHHTAEMSKELLRTNHWLNQLEDEYKKLWEYHAIEESELSHCSLAFDLYKKQNRPEIEKNLIMIGATIILWIALSIITAHFIYKDKDFTKLEVVTETYTGLKMLLNGNNGFLYNVFKQIPKYLNKDFHPHT